MSEPRPIAHAVTRHLWYAGHLLPSRATASTPASSGSSQASQRRTLDRGELATCSPEPSSVEMPPA